MIDAVFAPREAIELGQNWRETPESAYSPAFVRVGWTRDALWFYAQLHDDDPFNAATEPNQATHELGDVFEIFLRPQGQNRYFELHVTPQNQTLQLEFVRESRDEVIPEGAPHADLWHHTQTRIEREARMWRVFVGIRFSPMCQRAPEKDAQWKFSCSRYDCARDGSRKPILSSTSPHGKINFHDQSAWGTLVFLD